jgi:mono/diheme cytochrome c family protein
MKKFILGLFLPAILLCQSCNSGTNQSGYSQIPSDSLTVKKGKTLFMQNCSACHDFRQDGIGPQLAGITQEVSSEWLQQFIQNPQTFIDGGDERAVAQYQKFKTYMPPFEHLGLENIEAVISYLNTIKTSVQLLPEMDVPELENPIEEPIPLSELVIDLNFVAQIPPSSDENPRARIAKMDFQPGTNDFFVLDLRGNLYRLKDGQSTPYMQMAELIPDFINQPGLATGFGSFAFHPEFPENGLLYTTHTESPHSSRADFSYSDSIKVTLQWVISEWKTDDPFKIPFEGKRKELFRVNMVTGVHGVQEITFNPLAKPGDEDYGLLYIGIGDGGSVGAGFPFIVHSRKTIWGKIVRIDPAGNNSKNARYGIPQTNPFAAATIGGALGEIYAMGFRNPHRITWLRNGDMIASNIGQFHIESLYKVLPGNNYGWPIREGAFLINPDGDINKVYPLPEDDATFNISYPIAQYSHAEGNAISGGFEYWGNELSELKGKYIFGDIVNGRFFYIDVADIRPGNQAPIRELQLKIDGERTSFAEKFNNTKVDIRFGRDHLGELWVSSKIDGKVYRITGASGK